MTVYVWGILAGSAVGLLASTLGRLYASTYYALQDTRTPLRFGMIRVILTIVLGYLFAIPLPPPLGHRPARGARPASRFRPALAGWVEFFLLRRGLNRRIGGPESPAPLWRGCGAGPAAAAVAAWAVKLASVRVSIL